MASITAICLFIMLLEVVKFNSCEISLTPNTKSDIFCPGEKIYAQCHSEDPLLWEVNGEFQFEFRSNIMDMCTKKKPGKYMAYYDYELKESIFAILNATENITIACGNDTISLEENLRNIYVLSNPPDLSINCTETRMDSVSYEITVVSSVPSSVKFYEVTILREGTSRYSALFVSSNIMLPCMPMESTIMIRMVDICGRNVTQIYSLTEICGISTITSSSTTAATTTITILLAIPVIFVIIYICFIK